MQDPFDRRFFRDSREYLPSDTKAVKLRSKNNSRSRFTSHFGFRIARPLRTAEIPSKVWKFHKGPLWWLAQTSARRFLPDENCVYHYSKDAASN
jgi:hypothetical protein